MDFITSIKTCFIKYVDSTGRASRPEFWYFFLFTIIIIICADIIDARLAGQTYWSYLDEITYGPVYSIVNISIFLPSIAVSVRRLHDINRSGWWLLIIFTIIGLIPLIYWLCKKSNQDENHFGV